jgi:tetratricopeptide (TPR) repeat protein
MSDEAIQRCQAVLSDAGCKQGDAFHAGLILRDANHLDLLIEHVEAKYDGTPSNLGLQRLYGYACVVTNHAPADGVQLLSQIWNSSPSDGYAVADYASALSLMGRTSDAMQLFDRGLQDCKAMKNDRRTLLEEYAKFLARMRNTTKAHELYRDLLRYWPYALHNHRRFAQCLIDTAASARNSGSQGLEDSCVSEAEQVIRKLLEIAPADRWAADFLNRIQHRGY